MDQNVDWRQRLMNAARDNNLQILSLVSNANDGILQDNELWIAANPLHVAAVAGSRDFAAYIVAINSSFASQLNASGLSPLHLASQYGHWEVAQDLSRTTELCLLKGDLNMIPLHCAAAHDKVKAIEVLLQACPHSVIEKTSDQETALHLAAKNGCLRAYKMLYEHLKQEELWDVVHSKDKGDMTASEYIMKGLPTGWDDNANGSHVDRTKDYMLMIAALFLSAAYATVLSPPGGFWQDNYTRPHSAGKSIWSTTQSYGLFHIFVFGNAMIFMSCLYTIQQVLKCIPFAKPFQSATVVILPNFAAALFYITPSSTVFLLLNGLSIVIPIVCLFIYHKLVVMKKMGNNSSELPSDHETMNGVEKARPKKRGKGGGGAARRL